MVCVWASGVIVKALVGLATPKVTGSTPGIALSGNSFGQVVQAHVPLVSKQYDLVLVSCSSDALQLGR